MNKILVATEKPFAPAAVNGIREVVEGAGYEFILLEKYADKSELYNAIADVHAVIVRSDKITADVLDAAKELKIVVRAGAGYDNVDLAAASEKAIVVMNTPGQNANAVAELALGMMVYMARGCYNGKPGTELRGKTLGLHAFGAVGKWVSEIAKGFGMDLYAFDPFISKDIISAVGITPVDSVEELYSKCQYVSVHIPANDQTRNSIDFNLLSKMPKNGTLINTARKEVVCEESLMRIFSERDDFKYVTDVAPDCADEIVEKYSDRYYATPKKMGAQTGEANVNSGIAAANQIVNYLEKGDTTFQVN